MGYRHTREEIVDAAAAVVLQHGVGRLTFQRVADHLGISDRMVVYYLPTKHDLVLAAATSLSASLQQLLAVAFGTGRRDPDELLAAAWPVLGAADADPVFRAFLEVIGLAAAGTSPFDQLAPALLTGWVDWVSDRVTGPSDRSRRATALGVIARLDGLLLVRHALGPAAADDAALALGIARRRRRSG